MIKNLSDFTYVDPFRRYSRSKSKVVRNRAEFRTIFGCRKFRGRAFQKLYASYHPCLAARRLEKFPHDTPSPEVIDSNNLNFKPNLKFSRLIFFWGGRVGGGRRPPPNLGCALASLSESIEHVKI